MQLQTPVINVVGTNNLIKPRGHDRNPSETKNKKSHLNVYLEKIDPYPEKVKSQFDGVLKQALKELSEGVIKFKVSEEYQEKLKRDEIVSKLQYRLKQLHTYRRVFNIRRIQLDGQKGEEEDSEIESSSRDLVNSIVKEESSNLRSDFQPNQGEASQRSNLTQIAFQTQDGKSILEYDSEYRLQIDGRLIKVWEMDLDDLIELQDEIMGEEGELDAEMKQYINEEREKYFKENPETSDEEIDEDQLNINILQAHQKSNFNALKILGFKLKEIANVANVQNNPQKMKAFGGIQRRFQNR